jgi:RNA polymerase sigma factor (sigma-70 family)
MASPTGYLYRVAFNLHRRGFRRAIKSLVQGRSSVQDPISQLDETAAIRQDVRLALASVSKEQREILVLREWLDLGAEDIGAILRISPSTARVRLHRARASLRERLGDGYERG